MDIEGAVMAVREALRARRIPHVLFGKYAVGLALCDQPDGLDWRSPVITILVDGFKGHVINVILSSNELFSLTEDQGLVYTPVICFVPPHLPLPRK